MPRVIDHQADRADAYRRRAIALSTEARRENDPGQRRHLIDLARNYVNVADDLTPLLPEDEQPFRVRNAEAEQARVALIDHLRSRSRAG